MKVPITVFVEVDLLNRLDTRIKSSTAIKNRSDYINSLIEKDNRDEKKNQLDVTEQNKQTNNSINKKKGSKKHGKNR